MAKDRSLLVRLLRRHLPLEASTLVVGGSDFDRELLNEVGIHNPAITNLSENVDAEDLPFGDAIWDLVFAHAVLHHCYCPAKAVAEMLRVTKYAVAFIEPNDCWFIRTITRLGFLTPTSLPLSPETKASVEE